MAADLLVLIVQLHNDDVTACYTLLFLIVFFFVCFIIIIILLNRYSPLLSPRHTVLPLSLIVHIQYNKSEIRSHRARVTRRGRAKPEPRRCPPAAGRRGDHDEDEGDVDEDEAAKLWDQLV